MNDLESAEKIAIDIEKLERNLKQVAHITFEGSEKEVYDRAIDYKNDSKYYLEKERTFRCIKNDTWTYLVHYFLFYLEKKEKRIS